MRRLEYLLLCLEEELLETAHRVSKAIRFGLDEIQSGQDKTNGERIKHEMEEVVETYDMIVELTESLSIPRNYVDDCETGRDKRVRIEKYMNLSRELGILQEDK